MLSLGSFSHGIVFSGVSDSFSWPSSPRKFHSIAAAHTFHLALLDFAMVG
jgi:hypothetical protein